MGLNFDMETVRCIYNSRRIADINNEELISKNVLLAGILIHKGTAKTIFDENVPNNVFLFRSIGMIEADEETLEGEEEPEAVFSVGLRTMRM